MLIIDVREAFSHAKTGKGQWTAGLLRELLRRPQPLILMSDRIADAEWSALLRPEHDLRVFQKSGIRWHRRVSRELHQFPGAHYLSPTSYLLPAFSNAPVRFLTVVHDLIAFRNEPHEKRATWIERLSLGRALRKSEKIFSVSDATKRDLLARFSSVDAAKILTVHAGPGSAPLAHRPDGKTIYCLSTLCPRKNQLRLIEAYRALPSSLREKSRLVLAGGRGWMDGDIVRAASETPGVEWKGYVSKEEADRLLSSCEVFAYPSLYEGFGLPVLDALQSGVPTLTSDTGSLSEVAGDAALLADPLSVPSITDGLSRLLTDETLRKMLSEKGPKQASSFSWKKTADLVLSALSVDNIA